MIRVLECVKINAFENYVEIVHFYQEFKNMLLKTIFEKKKDTKINCSVLNIKHFEPVSSKTQSSSSMSES